MPKKVKTNKPKYLLKLYVAGNKLSPKHIESLKIALKGTGYKMIIIDILTHPEEAEKDNVLATPTLIKELPPPLRRVVGSLVDKEGILTGLDTAKGD